MRNFISCMYLRTDTYNIILLTKFSGNKTCGTFVQFSHWKIELLKTQQLRCSCIVKTVQSNDLALTLWRD